MLAKRWLYRLGTCGLAFALTVQAGCLQFLHPVDPLPKEEIADNAQVPRPCKNGVYVFLLQGIDPFDAANMAGLREYLLSLGYIKTYFGQPFHAFHYEKEIVAIRERDPNARFVVVGFSYAAGLARDIACGVGKRGIDIDLLVYVDGVEWSDRPLVHPKNVLKVVNILAFDRRDKHNVAGAENLRYNDVWHFGTVTHPQTLRMLVRELGEVALRVPVIRHMPSSAPAATVPGPEGLPPPQLAPERLPAPQPAPERLPAPKPVGKRGEWDFLKPDGNAVGAAGGKPMVDSLNSAPATIGQK